MERGLISELLEAALETAVMLRLEARTCPLCSSVEPSRAELEQHLMVAHAATRYHSVPLPDDQESFR